MPKVPIPYGEFVRKLKKLGFSGPYRVGRHPYMVKEKLKLAIPHPHGKDINDIGLLKRILKRANISDEEWDSV